MGETSFPTEPEPDPEPDPERKPHEPDNIRNDRQSVTTFSYDAAGDALTVVREGGTWYTFTHAAPRFDWEHLADKRLFALTAKDKTEYWRDNPTRYLVVEPDPETGMMKPATRIAGPFTFGCAGRNAKGDERASQLIES
jgi:hypothetical protein